MGRRLSRGRARARGQPVARPGGSRSSRTTMGRGRRQVARSMDMSGVMGLSITRGRAEAARRRGPITGGRSRVLSDSNRALLI